MLVRQLPVMAIRGYRESKMVYCFQTRQKMANTWGKN